MKKKVLIIAGSLVAILLAGYMILGSNTGAKVDPVATSAAEKVAAELDAQTPQTPSDSNTPASKADRMKRGGK